MKDENDTDKLAAALGLRRVTFGPEDEPEPVKDGRTWGRWRLKASSLVLEYVVYEVDYCPYEIDLERMRTPCEMLDWIMHMQDKAWMTLEDMGNLVAALNDIFNPRATLCSGLKSKSLDATKHLKELLKLK